MIVFMSFILSAKESPKTPTIAVIGSSVSAGWGGDRNENSDLLNGWTSLLKEQLEQSGYEVINLSIPGNNTIDILERFDSAVYPIMPDIAIIALSLSNEGIESEDGDKVIAQFESNMKQIIDKCDSKGIKPVIASCYANNGYNAEMYKYILYMNNIIESWNLPSINLLNSLDDGNGNFPKGTFFDPNHPNSKGHKELFLGIEPNMFNKIISCTYPDRAIIPSKSLTLVNKPFSYCPDSPMHSFSFGMTVDAKKHTNIFQIKCLNGVINISTNKKGEITVNNQNSGHFVKTNKPVNIVAINNYAMKTFSLYLDNTCIYNENTYYEPIIFEIAGDNNRYGDIILYRFPLSETEITALAQGVIPVTGLSIYSEGIIINNSMPNNGLSANCFSSDKNCDSLISQLKTEIINFNNIPEFTFESYYNIVKINLDVYKNLVGTYKLNDDVMFDIKTMNNKLWVLPNGFNPIELLPMSESKYIAKTVGPEAIITFSRIESSDTYNLMEFSMDSYTDSMYKQ